jgi:hypothetical protein
MRRPVVTSLSTLLIAAPLAAQCELQRFVGSDSTVGDHFGSGIEIWGDRILIGSRNGLVVGPNSGRAHVFLRTGVTWVQEASLQPLDPSAGALFGESVALEDDLAVVGAYRKNDVGSGSGAAYVFRRTGTTWSQETKLLPGDLGSGDNFGTDVGLFGDAVVVGAPRAGDPGAAYVFRFDGTSWNEEAKLVPSDAHPLQQFGTSVAIDGDAIAVGAIDPFATGAAHVFRFDGAAWSQEAILTPAAGAAGDLCGTSIELEGDTLLVGARLADAGLSDGGAAWVFVHDGATWGEEALLLSSDLAADDGFGHRVSLDGDAAYVTAYLDDDAGAESGAVYAFRRASGVWTETTKLLPYDAAADDHAGSAVFARDGLLAIGAYHADTTGPDAGEAYVFTTPDDCHATCYGGDAGNPARLTVEKATTLGGLVTLVHSEPTTAPASGLTFAALAATSQGTSVGTLLIDPLTLLALPLPPAPFASTADRPSQLVPLPADGALAGFSVFLQAAVVAGASAELTNAVQVTLCP